MLSEPIRHRLMALPVANIGDSLDRLYVVAAAIKPVWPGCKIVGPAYTVLTAAGDNKAIHEAIDKARPGDVVVVNGQGYEDRALVGELMAGRAVANALTAFVIDGAVRDKNDLTAMRFPVFARAVTPAGPYRNGPGIAGRPVAIGGVVVSPGDIIVGDDDGLVVIPQDELLAVVEKAEAKMASETAQRDLIGIPIG